MDNNEELVSVMVPRRMLTQVYGLMHRLDSGAKPEDNGSSTVEPISRGDESTSDFTEKLLRRVVGESAMAMRDIFGLLASRPGEWLDADDLAKALKGKKDADWNTIAGTLGAFGRRMKNRYKSDQWPFEAKYIPGQKGCRYRMTPVMAKRIKQLLKETSEDM